MSSTKYDELIGLPVEVHLHDGGEIIDRDLVAVADIYGSPGGELLILVDNSGTLGPNDTLAVPTHLVKLVSSD